MPLVPALLAMVLAAEPDTYAIVDVDSPDMMIGLANQVTKVVLDSAAQLKLQVMTPEQVRSKVDEKQYPLLMKCGGQPTCVAKYIGATGAKKVVLGSLSRNEKSYVFKLWLIDLQKLDVVADVDRQVLIAARRLQRDVEQAAPALLRGEQEARGTLLVTTNVAKVELTLNGEAVGTAPYEVKLKPGKYEIKAERPKYLSVTRLVNVEANQKTEAELKLLLMPGAVPDDDSAPGAKVIDVNHPSPASSGGAVHLGAPTWVAGGATLIALGVASGFGIAARNGDKAITDSLSSSSNTYSATRKDALTVQSNALAANVAFGVAGAAGIATIIFLVLDVTHPSGVEVAPTVSPSGAGVTVGGAF